MLPPHAPGASFILFVTCLQGGGWYAEKEGTMRITDGYFVNNTAKHGGGLSAVRDVVAIITNSTLINNSAVHAGALECFSCESISMTRQVVLGGFP